MTGRQRTAAGNCCAESVAAAADGTGHVNAALPAWEPYQL